MRSKAKGNAFERAQAKVFSLWVSDGNDKDLFWRSTLSGGRASMGKVVGTQYGDLAIQRHEGKYVKEARKLLSMFCVELKRHRSIDLYKAMLNEGNKLRKWWAQCRKEAAKHKVIPMLVVKADRVKEIVIFERGFGNRIIRAFSFIIRRYFKLSWGSNFRVVGILQKDLFAINWKTFFEKMKEGGK